MVGYDGRHNSSRWASLTAGVFIRAKVAIHTITTNTNYKKCRVFCSYSLCLHAAHHILSFVPGASDSLPNNGADPLHSLHRDEERRCGRGDGHCESQSKVLQQLLLFSVMSLKSMNSPADGTMTTRCIGEMVPRFWPLMTKISRFCSSQILRVKNLARSQAAILENLAPQPGSFQEPPEDHPLLSNPLDQVVSLIRFFFTSTSS